MAMTECRECGSDVRNKADQCPNCGVSNPGRKWYNPDVGGCGGCLVVLVVVGIIAAIAGGESDQAGTSSTGGSEFISTGPTHVERHAHQTINVRIGPSTGHDVVTQLSAGDRAYVAARTNDWTVLYGGPGSSDTVGFVYGELLEDRPLPDLQVLDTEWETGEYGNNYAVGRIRNNSNRTYDYVQVSVNSTTPAGRRLVVRWPT